VLINCSRGDVVQKQALIDALEGGRLAGCGLDVHWVRRLACCWR
jgi:lactate dehydrogenase-like 2-hydroxyacid dehydrogenase